MVIGPTDLRHLRPLDPPLSGYIRPFRRDSTHLSQLIAEGMPVGAGIVLDCIAPRETRALRDEARRSGLEVILDPRSMELATPGGFSRAPLRQLPWAGESIHQPHRFLDQRAPRLVEDLVRMAVEMGATAVLSPTHYLEKADSPWLGIDIEIAQHLRRTLDRNGGTEIALYYVWGTNFQALTEEERTRVITRLRGEVPMDALWLRVHNFGTSSSGPVNLRRYIRLARACHQLGIPIVAERTGTVGLGLLAIGAVGGIESGITAGDIFNASSLLRPSRGRGFVPAPRVYLPSIGAFLRPDRAANFLQRRGMHGHICQGRGCCHRGMADMVGDPRRHFVVTRAREIESLSSLPAAFRGERYLESWLRPASDRATRAMAVDTSLERHRNRLDGWRGTLGAILEEDLRGEVTRSSPPEGRRLRRRPA